MSVTRFPSRFGKYILLDRINSGGMAEVYRAKVTGVEGFQRLVAIKCMLPQLVEDAQFTTMFIDEAKLAAQLTHPSIVQIHELGRIGRRLYIAMELISGHDLRHVVRSTHRQGMSLPPAFALYVIAKAAEALDFAHRKVSMDGAPLNLVHRDVSPQNILISYDGDVKVVDFGIAKAEARATETQAGTIKGKFAYMAPEQVAGQDVDRRADIFSLGAVLFEALSGQRLFQGESDMSILDKVSRVDIEPVHAFVADGHGELEEVFRRTLTRSPADRYGYASELAEALEPLLIDKKRMFNAKNSRAFMQMLYADDITFLSDRMRDYAGIGDADVVEVATDDTPRHRDITIEHNEQVFETDFGSGRANNATTSIEPGLGATERNDLSPHKTMQFEGGVPTSQFEAKTEIFDAIDQIDVDIGTPVLRGSKKKLAKATVQPPLQKSRFGVLAVAAMALLILALGFGLAVRQRWLPSSVMAAVGQTSVGQRLNPPVAKVVASPTSSRRISEASPPSATGSLSPSQVVLPPPAAPVVVVLPPDPPAPPPPATIPAPVVSTVKPVREETPAIISPPHSKEIHTPPRVAPRRPPPPPPPPPVVETNYGYMSVIAIGLSGKVFVDGEDVGFTPIVAARVKAGKHIVRVVDTQSNGEERRQEVTISIDDTRKAPKKVIVRF